MTALGRTLSNAEPRAGGASRPIAVLLALTAGINLLYVLALLPTSAVPPAVAIALSLATQWVPATVFWLVAARTRVRSLPVVLAAAAVTASALGDTYYSLAMDADGYLPSPSLADPAYLLFYPLMVAALFALVRGRLRGLGALVVLESAVATAGAAAVLAVVLDPVIGAALVGDDPLASVVALSYPLFDLVLLATIAGLASVPTIRLGRRWWALVAGLLFTAFGDILYALLDNVGTYLAGTPLDATWAISLALMAWWVAGMPEPEAVVVTAPRRGAIPVPAFAVVAGIAVLIVGTRVPTSVLAVSLAAVTVALGALPILFRQRILGRMLADQAEAVRRLTALDQAKTDILVTMNHAFRTPLTSITGRVELLLDGAAGALPERAVGMLQAIERNAERLQELIDETLTSTRLDEGQELLDRVPTPVGRLVTRAVERVGRFADERGVDVAGPNPTEVVVDADVAHLEQALVNLLDNAVKFSPTGSTVAVSVHARDRDRVEVRVRDRGIGIPEADIPSLSTRFFRASNVQNAAIPGVGLGFSIAEQVALAHGGSLEVESAVDVGTTVTLVLPVSRPAPRDRRARRSTF